MNALLLAAFLVPASPPPAQFVPDLSVMFLPGVQVEAPGRVTAGLTVFFPTSAQPGFRRDGWLVEANAGLGGGRLAFGRAGYLEYLGLDARVFVSRTWNSPLGASNDSTYIGAEGGLALGYIRVALGVGQRISGPAGEYGTILTWSAGAQFPFFK